MTQSFNLNGPIYTAHIRIATHKSIELLPTVDIHVWISSFFMLISKEQDISRKASFEKCCLVLELASICFGSLNKVSCCTDITGIGVEFVFKFEDPCNLEAFMHEMSNKSMQEDE